MMYQLQLLRALHEEEKKLQADGRTKRYKVQEERYKNRTANDRYNIECNGNKAIPHLARVTAQHAFFDATAPTLTLSFPKVPLYGSASQNPALRQRGAVMRNPKREMPYNGTVIGNLTMPGKDSRLSSLVPPDHGGMHKAQKQRDAENAKAAGMTGCLICLATGR